MEQLIVIRTKLELEALCLELKDADLVSYDTETTGLTSSAEIIGLSVAFDLDKAHYVILRAWNKETSVLENLETLGSISSLLNILLTKRLIMHNAVFDCKMTMNNFKVDLMGALHTDTIELAHILDENRPVGLKALALTEFGETSTTEQGDMKRSILENGGSITKKNYELYKADAELIARYGAKDALLTLKLFYQFVPILFERGLDKFFYEEESMPLLKTVTYDLNTAGLKVDIPALEALKQDLIQTCNTMSAEIMADIAPYIKDLYPGTTKKNVFNLGSNQQLAWLLFIKLGNDFKKLTKGGREISKNLIGKVPYNPGSKTAFIKACIEQKLKPEKYLQVDSKALMNLAKKYKWVEKLIEFNRLETLLNGFVRAIESRVEYGIIRPSFLQHGTTSGRYASREPNFQNQPRDDKRVKKCIIPRPACVFVSADFSQLEPRIFASFSQDTALMKCFETGEDFYSVIGIPVFQKFECSAYKKDENYFGKTHENLRNISKKIALSATYGTTAYKLSDELRDEEGRNLSPPECQAILDGYFKLYPKVHKFMLESHEQAKNDGVVHSLYGRPRNIPEAKQITLYRGVAHHQLPYQLRTFLNLGVNHRVQSTAASIVNRSAIALHKAFKRHSLNANIVLQVHDSLVVECLYSDKDKVAKLLQHCLEYTVDLPGVKLVAEPKIGYNLAEA